ncbi:type IV pilus biogenesis protein PilM [Ferroacidibacillus organovorans]|nr:hypothetical protein [Ferroacidibacillus organovorans]
MARTRVGLYLEARSFRWTAIRHTRSNVTRLGSNEQRNSEDIDETSGDSTQTRDLGKVMKGNGFQGVKTVIGLANHQFIVRYVTVPTVPDQYLKSMIQNELGLSIHLPFEDALFDAVVVPPLTEIDPKLTAISLIAAPREHVNRAVELAKRAQLQPIAVDIPPLALYRLISKTCVEPCFYTLIHVEKEDLSISIFRQGFLYFYRNLELVSDVQTDFSSTQFAQMLTSEIERILNFFQMSFPGLFLQKNVYLFYSQLHVHDLFKQILTNRGESTFYDLSAYRKSESSNDFRQIMNQTPVSEFVSLGLAIKEGVR